MAEGWEVYSGEYMGVLYPQYPTGPWKVPLILLLGILTIIGCAVLLS